MIRTEGNKVLALDGVDQQDFEKLQEVAGCYPNLIGLQQRLPGKTIEQFLDGPILDIAVFYLYYGRPFRMINWGGTIEITKIPLVPWSIPVAPNTTNIWMEPFTDYEPVGLISRLWGAGIWLTGIGVCETLIEGYIDPFKVFAEIKSGEPTDVPTVVEDSSDTPAAEDTGPNFYYPREKPQIVLKRLNADGDLSCHGQGTTPQQIDDLINVYYEPGNLKETVPVTDFVVKARTPFYGIVVGRVPDEYIGIVATSPPASPAIGCVSGPPSFFPYPPDPTIYFYNINNGEYGQES